MKTKLLTKNDIGIAAEILRAGGLVGIPTETVYGLGANGLDPDAVKAIFEAKGRPQDNPLILHIPDESWLERIALKDAVDKLPEREKRILALRFFSGKTQMEVSNQKSVV